MHPRRKLLLLLAIVFSLPVFRELVVPGWTLYRSESNFQTRTFGSADQAFLAPGGFGANWELIDMPGSQAVQLRYSERVSAPWTRWIPLVKFGRTTVERRFAVISQGTVILSGRSDTEIDLTIYGFASAQKYLALAKSKSTKSISDWARREMKKNA
jgi:hypothetical protein